jgi:CRISPR-associated exonuclease Cas4
MEQAWADNLFTAEGNILHRRTDRAEAETRGDIHVARSLRLQSLALGLTEIADVVEFHRVGDDRAGLQLPRLHGRWRPYPVEYKRGRPKASDCDQVQVCAQVLCLEEMLRLDIPEILESEDSLRFYFLGSNWRKRVEHVGAKPSYDPEGPLIV